MPEDNDKVKGLTRKQWFTIFAIGSVHFASAICVSLQAPFYPQEAESKNVTATEYGFVFGIYELTAFISSPIVGNYIDVIGAKRLLNFAVVLSGGSVIAFGFLGLVQSHDWFISLSFLIRITEALGASASVTSAFAITADTFPDNVATTFAALETFYGMGYIVGPAIGGFIYSFGGYIPPFLVMGTILLFDGVFVYFVLPETKRNVMKSKVTLLQMLKIPALLIDAFAVTATSICVGFYAATLEPHIRDFNLSPIVLGLVFVISGGTYAIMSPFVGRLCDKKCNPRHMILGGTTFIITSVLLVGPAPFLPISPKFSLVITGLVLEGFGMAFILVSAFIDALRSSVCGGFPDDITTYGIVAGLWASAFALGDFIGPSVAGALCDLFGFKYASLFIIVIHILLFIIMMTFLMKRKSHKVCPITTIPGLTDSLKRDGLSPSVILEDNILKINGAGYGTIKQKPEDSFSKF